MVRYTLLSLAVLLLPAVAQADRLRVTSYDMDDRGGTVRLQSNVAVGEPWLRIEGRTIKIWFPHIVDVARFDHEREMSEPIHALSLRGGASDTAVLKVELGTGHSITREDIGITRDGQQAAVKLLVPTAKPAVPAAASPSAEPAAVAAGPNAVAAAQPAAAAVYAQQPPPASKPAAHSSNGSQGSQGEAADLSGIGAAGEDDADEALGTLDDTAAQPTSPLWLLGVASMLLAGVWFGLQHLQRTKRFVNSAAIEIVGSRRLGHRQELLIVRALGADHLLLCTHGRAERVASSVAGALPLPPQTSAPASERAATPAPVNADAPATANSPTQAGGIGLMSRLSSQHRLRKLLDSVESEATAAESDAPEHAFHEELRTATTQRALLHSLPAPAARQSDAVAGITRLRQRRSS